MGDTSPVKMEPQGIKEKVVYELAADGTCLFENGESIRISRTMLAFHSQFFTEAFFGPKPVTEIKIKGFDKASFKLFLDCLLGLKSYTMLDALLIYPIAHEYEVTKSLKKCEAILKPQQMDANVPLVLNLASLYKCKELTDFVIKFIKTEYGLVNFLENEKYRNVLEPLSVLELVKNADLNSLLWTLVYQWGKNYVKDHKRLTDPSLLTEYNLSSYISLDHFESAKALTNFHALTDKQILCPNEILSHLEANMLQTEKKLPDKSGWSKINSGDSLTEMIVFKPSIWASANSRMVFNINPNKVLVEPENSSGNIVKVEARYLFREVTWDSPPSSPDWREDLNFFYSVAPSDKDYHFSLFNRSQSFCFDLDVGGSVEEPCGKFECEMGRDVYEIQAVEVTYTFKSHGRILKASLCSSDMSFSGNDNDKIGFTRDVSVNELKKDEK